MDSNQHRISRRDLVLMVTALALPASRSFADSNRVTKPLRGAMPITLTPYAPSGAVDFDDLAAQIRFYGRIGCTGAVWPQANSDVGLLSRDERRQGMKVIVEACRPTQVASVVGVQGATTGEMLDYAEFAESLGPDAMIAMPPSGEQSMSAYYAYFSALAGVTGRPIVIQTSIPGMPGALAPSLDLIFDLARQFPNFGYVKEESAPLVGRMTSEVKQHGLMKGVFGASGGDGWLYELRLGLDGEMTAQGMYGDVMAAIFNLYEKGRIAESADAFSKLLLMKNCEHQIPGTERYIFVKRGVFKSRAQRRGAPMGTGLVPELSELAVKEIESRYALLRPYLIQEI